MVTVKQVADELCAVIDVTHQGLFKESLLEGVVQEDTAHLVLDVEGEEFEVVIFRKKEKTKCL